jgi:hypothetical protein
MANRSVPRGSDLSDEQPLVRRWKVAGVLMSQILPFADPAVLGLSDQFERGVYKIAV